MTPIETMTDFDPMNIMEDNNKESGPSVYEHT